MWYVYVCIHVHIIYMYTCLYIYIVYIIYIHTYIYEGLFEVNVESWLEGDLNPRPLDSA